MRTHFILRKKEKAISVSSFEPSQQIVSVPCSKLIPLLFFKIWGHFRNLNVTEWRKFCSNHLHWWWKWLAIFTSIFIRFYFLYFCSLLRVILLFILWTKSWEFKYGLLCSIWWLLSLKKKKVFISQTNLRNFRRSEHLLVL